MATLVLQLSAKPLKTNPQQKKTKAKTNLSNLETWQRDRLESAFLSGKRNIKVSRIADEISIPRSDVLLWLKTMRSMPEEVRESLLESHAESNECDQVLKEHVENVRLKKQKQKNMLRKRPDVDADWTTPRPLSRIQLAALEKLFEMTKWPGNDQLKSLK